jgi:hypothetical protein
MMQDLFFRGSKSAARMSMFFALLLVVFITGGCSEQKPAPEPEPVIKPVGFRVVPTVGGQNMYTPHEKGSLFVVVTVEVPVSFILPTAAEYKTMQSNQDTIRKITLGEIKDTVPPIKQCRMYRSSRFTLIVPNGKGYHGDLVASSGSDFFSQDMSFWKTSAEKESVAASGSETLDLAFVIDKLEAKSPLQLQLDRYPPVAVPENKQSQQ